MFKITGRIVLILLAGSLVAVVLYLLVNGAAGQPGLLGNLDRRGGFDGGFRIVANRQADPGAFLAQGISILGLRSNFNERGLGGRYSLSRGLSDVLGDLIAVTLITALVVLLHKPIKKALRRPPQRTF